MIASCTHGSRFARHPSARKDLHTPVLLPAPPFAIPPHSHVGLDHALSTSSTLLDSLIMSTLAEVDLPSLVRRVQLCDCIEGLHVHFLCGSQVSGGKMGKCLFLTTLPEKLRQQRQEREGARFLAQRDGHFHHAYSCPVAGRNLLEGSSLVCIANPDLHRLPVVHISLTQGVDLYSFTHTGFNLMLHNSTRSASWR